MKNLKLKTILLIVKLLNKTIKITKLGSGNTLPGYLATILYPNILQDITIKYPKGIVFISGTNGKTTTTKLLTHLLENNFLKVLTNSSGANILNGFLSTVLLDLSISGVSQKDIGVFEVDEFTLPNLLQYITPKYLVLLNLSRDQLDRYGETDIILEKWHACVKKLPKSSTLILDKTQDYFKILADSFKGTTLYFDECSDYTDKTNLVGLFNCKNVNAAVAVASLLNFTKTELIESLKTFDVAYGRGEIVNFKNKTFQIFLAKNPASFDHNLNMIVDEDVDPDTLLLILNDNIPDGRDVSWIFDISTELLAKSCLNRQIFITGSRCYDMAIRLYYAGISVPKDHVVSDLNKSLNKILVSQNCNNVLVFPNYSAMLMLRKILLGRSIL